MKNFKKILHVIVMLGAIVTSCTDYERPEFTVDKPESIASQELIDQYDGLKTYLDTIAYPNFRLGANLSLSNYTDKGLMYRLINSNFNEVTFDEGVQHGDIVNADGSFDFSGLESLFEITQLNGLSVFGKNLISSNQQNADYLNELIAPKVVSSTGPGWVLVTEADFETDNNSNYESNSGLTLAFTEDGQGANGVGRALMLTNASVRTNDWDAQFFLKFPPVQEGEKYILQMDIRSDVDASYPTQAHVTPGAYKHWDFFGSLSSTTTWQTYTKEITVSASQATCGTLAFNMGKTATNFYFDNITLTKYSETGSIITEERTPEEKKAIIGEALDNWVSTMVTNSAPYINAWNVVDEPMDDQNPYEVKSGLEISAQSGEFYWQDYLGKDYGVMAFKKARENGNAEDLLFISDYGLETNLDKCKGLIQYVEYLETQGAQVDGIGAKMHLTVDSDKDDIVSMLQLLVATGKQIAISDLYVQVLTNTPTEEILQEQADMYQDIVQIYLDNVPTSQRYGIIVRGVKDNTSDSSWLPGEKLGLWDINYVRKPAYVGFSEGLKLLNN